MNQSDNDCKDKYLQQDETGAYKPAYKHNPKTGQKEAISLSPELVEMATVWPELPEHIKAAIKALVQTHCKEVK